MVKRRGRPRKRQPQKKKIGKATPLPGDLWCQWLIHVINNGQCWLYAALLLSHLLCLRITEVLRLKGSDFQWKQECVRIGPLKRQAATVKHMIKGVLPILLDLRKKPLKRKRKRNKGFLGCVQEWDTWSWPKDEGLLFPSHRSDASTLRRNKDTACKAVSRLRATFFPKKAVECTSRIRTHSGRHRMISDLKGSNVGDDAGMIFARIADKRTYHGYGQITCEQTAAILDKNKTLVRSLQTMYHKHMKVKNATLKRGA